jgi:hypothetical protein
MAIGSHKGRAMRTMAWLLAVPALLAATPPPAASPPGPQPAYESAPLPGRIGPRNPSQPPPGSVTLRMNGRVGTGAVVIGR